MKSLEIILPVYNEQETLPLLFSRLDSVFSKSEMENLNLKEIIFTFIDNNSQDLSRFLITEYLKTSSHKVRLVKFSRNFGHMASVTAGLRLSQGDYVAIIDSDLQDPPEIIPLLLQEAYKGYDVVNAIRKNRKENFLKRSAYWLFYRIYKFLSSIDVPVDSGDFCLMTKKAVTAANSLSESVRFPRGIRSWIGFKQSNVSYERASRNHGSSKYSWKDLFSLATNGITAFSVRPLKLTQYLATVYFLFSTALSCFLVFEFKNSSLLKSETTIVLLSMTITNMFLMVILHIHGAYLGRTFLETKKRPVYVIEETIDNEA